MIKYTAPLLLALITVGVTSVSAQMSTFTKVDLLIKDGLHKNQADINRKAQELSDVQRLVLIEEHEKSSWLPAIANFIIPFSLGSIVQGDPLGYVTGGIQVGLLTVGLVADGDASIKYTMGAVYLGYASAILPFIYASSYNTLLKNTLFRGDRFSDVYLAPELRTTVDGTGYLAMSVRIGF